jgi:hypothetical protein
MKNFILALFALSLVGGCSDPSETLRQHAIRDYSIYWQQPEQIALVRRTQSVPDDYKFKSLDLTGGVWDKEAHRGIYEWTFRFIREPVRDFIEVKHICYYDSDAVVPLEVKQERIHWLGMKIATHRFRFNGDEEERK